MEIAVEGAQLDGMICLSSCDKTPPAHLMAAGRFNVPTILVICGYQPSGHYNGAHVDIEEVFIGSVRAMFGKLSKETLAGMCDHAITGPRRLRRHGHGQLDAHRLRGARHDAARRRAGAGQQPGNVRAGPAGGAAESSRWCGKT
jgi:hypothetical protein